MRWSMSRTHQNRQMNRPLNKPPTVSWRTVSGDGVGEDVVDEDVVKEDIVSEDIAPPNEPRASDQAPRLQRDKPSMPVPSASEERLVPTSRLGGSARELLNDDGSLRKP